MKKSLLFVCVLFAFISCKQSASQSGCKETCNEKQIPILAWYGVKESTVDRYLELKNTGITHNFTGFDSLEDLTEAMDAAAEAGIKMIVSCPELEKEPERIVELFKDHPATAGYFLRDEPGRKDFPALGDWARRIQAVDNEHFCYLNLFPNYASAETLGTETYREYVRLFIEEVPLQILSFDHYPVVDDGAGNRFLRDMWYENLEIFSDEARKAGRPFWAFALTVAHAPYPIPTLAELRLQMYSNLAYGAQGLQYFTYWTPNDNPVWNFHHAPIDLDTKKRTEVYDKIKVLNAEIKNLSSVFLDSKVISIAHTGDNIPKGTKKLGNLPPVIQSFRVVGEGAIVSQLEKENMCYFVVVNRDFKNSMTVEIEGGESLQRVLKDGTSVPANLYHSTLNVDPGDILVFGWEKI